MKDVLEFYRTMPFNYYSSPEADAQRIKDRNAIKDLLVLEPLIKPGISCLEVGCGTGWLTNSLAYYYQANTTALDFNPVAIDRAKSVARILKVSPHFLVEDLFQFHPPRPYELICSVGVLHHTSDCLKALRIYLKMLPPGGYFYGGLYHRYGRLPFLQHFDALKSRLTEDELLEEFRGFHSGLKDQDHIRSWFRDQVLHPHETQHTLQEVVEVMERENIKLVSTSINRFQPITDLHLLFDREQEWLEVGKQKLAERKYFPGFFTFLGRKGI